MTLREQVIEHNKEIKEALETIFNELNHGQQQKLLKNEKIKTMLDKYKIEYEE